VIAVDTFVGERENNTRYASIVDYGGSTLQAFTRRIDRAGVSDLVTVRIERTTEAAKKQHRPVAFLLIDADHSLRGVKADFAAWLPHVSVGGWIVFHDYAMPDADVREFVDREVVSRRDIIANPGLVAGNLFAVTKTHMHERRRVERPVRFSADELLDTPGA